MKLPTTEMVVELLDNSNESVVGGNDIQLRRDIDTKNLVPLYIDAFYKIKKWPGRMCISFLLVRYAKAYRKILELGLHGLNDKSQIVRHHCCAILAYAGCDEYIPPLEKLLNHKNAETREDARAAIDAIKNNDHNLYADRDHTGNVFWDPGKIA